MGKIGQDFNEGGFYFKSSKTKKINKCRLCFNKKLTPIHKFGSQFVSNFVSKKNIKKGIF